MTYDKDDAAMEAALRAAFQRELPPPGLIERVEARVAAKGRASSMRSHVWVPFAIAAALVLAVILPLGLRLRHQAEVARGEAAKAQVLLALRITGTQLRTIRARTQSRHIGTMPEGESQ